MEGLENTVRDERIQKLLGHGNNHHPIRQHVRTPEPYMVVPHQTFLEKKFVMQLKYPKIKLQ